VNVLGLALLSGVEASGVSSLYLVALLVLTAAALAGGVRFKRFVFVVYGVIYAYAGISVRVLRQTQSETSALAYFVVSGCVVIGALVILARRFGREA
jgi:hypothetical protein